VELKGYELGFANVQPFISSVNLGAIQRNGFQNYSKKKNGRQNLETLAPHFTCSFRNLGANILLAAHYSLYLLYMLI
jgi:hypothetical protein